MAKTLQTIGPPEPPRGAIEQAIDYRLPYYPGVTAPETPVAGLGA